MHSYDTSSFNSGAMSRWRLCMPNAVETQLCIVTLTSQEMERCAATIIAARTECENPSHSNQLFDVGSDS